MAFLYPQPSTCARLCCKKIVKRFGLKMSMEEAADSRLTRTANITYSSFFYNSIIVTGLIGLETWTGGDSLLVSTQNASRTSDRVG